MRIHERVVDFLIQWHHPWICISVTSDERCNLLLWDEVSHERINFEAFILMKNDSLQFPELVPIRTFNWLLSYFPLPLFGRDRFIMSVFEALLSTMDAKLRRVENLDKAVEHLMRKMESLHSRVNRNIEKTEQVGKLAWLHSFLFLFNLVTRDVFEL